MTPAEQSRQIDREEFEAESMAARQRAIAHAKACRKLEKQKVRAWMKADEPVEPTFVLGCKPTFHCVNGEYRTFEQWANYLGIKKKALLTRRHKLGSLEAAIAMGGPQRPGKRPGVSSDFAPSKGTGAGSTAQETPKITFSEKA